MRQTRASSTDDAPADKRFMTLYIDLRQHTWTPIPEFQLVPLPSTNPILLGHRWKEYHLALGPNLNKIHEESWEIFKKEKRDNMVSALPRCNALRCSQVQLISF